MQRLNPGPSFVQEYIKANPQWEWAPKLHKVLCEQGRTFAKLGRNQEARAALEKSLAVEPDFERAQ